MAWTRRARRLSRRRRVRPLSRTSVVPKGVEGGQERINIACVVTAPIDFKLWIVPAQSVQPWPRTRGNVHGRIYEPGQGRVLFRAWVDDLNCIHIHLRARIGVGIGIGSFNFGVSRPSTVQYPGSSGPLGHRLTKSCRLDRLVCRS